MLAGTVPLSSEVMERDLGKQKGGAFQTPFYKINIPKAAPGWVMVMIFAVVWAQHWT